MRLRGSSGTDEHQHYVDDGLQRKYEGLHQMRLALNRHDFPPKRFTQTMMVTQARRLHEAVTSCIPQCSQTCTCQHLYAVASHIFDPLERPCSLGCR